MCNVCHKKVKIQIFQKPFDLNLKLVLCRDALFLSVCVKLFASSMLTMDADLKSVTQLSALCSYFFLSFSVGKS